jgi:hypothetical protein
MKFKAIKNAHFGYLYLFLTCIMMVTSFYVGCKELPQQAKNPDNPFDPNNPNNDIQGPALVLSPTKVEIKANEQFYLDLWVVEADPVTGISAGINFDPLSLQVESVDSLTSGSESFLLQNGGQLIFFSTIDNDNGYLQIDCAVVEGEPKEVVKNGKISRILFKHLSQTSTDISLSVESYMRDSDNDPVSINDLIDAEVLVKN